MTEMSIQNTASHLYDSCQEIVVAPNGERWDVFDGPGGPRIDTVDASVLRHVEDNYDSPVHMVDGSVWHGSVSP